MVSAARLARNRRTVANVIALGQGEGGVALPLGNARRFGMRHFGAAEQDSANVFMGQNVVKGIHVFIHDDTWANAMAYARTVPTQYQWVMDRGGFITWSISSCSDTEPTNEVALGLRDNELRELATIIARFDKSTRIVINWDWESNHATAYRHTYNRVGGYAEFIARWRRAHAIFKSVSPRFFFSMILIPRVSFAFPEFDWRLGFPGVEYVDGMGIDPYYNASSGVTQLQQFNAQFNAGLPDDATAMYDFARSYGLPFGIKEFGANTNSGDYVHGIERWCYGKIIYEMLYWDRLNGADDGNDFDALVTNGRNPLNGQAVKALVAPGTPYACSRDGLYHELNELVGKHTGYWDFARDDLAIVASNLVSSWRDMSAVGNFRNLAQATGAAQPTLNLTGWNGGKCLSFDGGDALTGTDNLGSGAVSEEIWFLAKGNDALQEVLFSQGGGGFANQIRILKTTSGFYRVDVGNGSSAVPATAGFANGTGKVAGRVVITPTSARIDVLDTAGNIIVGTPAAVVPNITAGGYSLGGAAGTGSFVGDVRLISTGVLLTDAEAAPRWARMKALRDG